MDFERVIIKKGNINAIEIEEKSNSKHIHFDSPIKDQDVDTSDVFDFNGENPNQPGKENDVVLCVSEIDLKDMELKHNLFSPENKKAIKGELNDKKNILKNKQMQLKDNSLYITDVDNNKAKEDDEKMKKKLVTDIIQDLNNIEEHEKRKRKIITISFLDSY